MHVWLVSTKTAIDASFSHCGPLSTCVTRILCLVPQLHVVQCIPIPIIETRLFVNEAMAATWFTSNDAEFLQWCDDHRSGFVVSARRKAGANSIVLHKASCLSVTQRRTPGAYTERGHIKCCADSIDDLRVELRRHLSGAELKLRDCPLCKP
jgi:hypothetical protein